jgi:hypothetical protein
MLALLAIAPAAPPPTESFAVTPDEDSIIMWVAARLDTCNIKSARKVSLEAFVRKPDQWAGKCIAVRGYWYGRALFQSPADARQKPSQSSDELDGQRVGIYGREEVLKSAPKHSRLFTAVGVANTCERLSEGAIMVMGYCHYTGGPIIVVAEMRPR